MYFPSREAVFEWKLCSPPNDLFRKEELETNILSSTCCSAIRRLNNEGLLNESLHHAVGVTESALFFLDGSFEYMKITS